MSRTYATPAAIITISILFPVLGTLTVILRFHTRRKTKSVLWIDDWLTLPALGLEYVLAALLLWGTTTGSLGGLLPQPDDPRPDAYVFSNSDQQIRLLQIQYVADIVTVWAFGFTKLSILYFYRSIFCSRRTIRTAFHSVTMCMIVLVSVWTVAFGVGTIFICGAHPVNAWGTIAVVTTECSLQVPIVEGYAISDFIMDVIIWLLPLPRIWLLNISVRQKMALGLVFLVGLLAIAASATRMAIYIAHLINPFAQSDGERLLVDRILFPLDAKPPQPNPEYETASHGNRWIQFQWSTGIYSSSKPEDFDAVNKAWEEIVPAYGFVAVDHGWAAENHLPSSMSLPSDSSKGVYILDA
ncbi:hypothetical protein AAWM_02186 [Aspergillus awamori]|uniref:Rhodopsin domain-containing protein n=1 Tax=Aspergillus awamori TaxID=105351 RepID=A0A401KJA7_ASPAW|nr:hypothetical protein AAWM_02186 [Aspergillus awamori]